MMRNFYTQIKMNKAVMVFSLIAVCAAPAITSNVQAQTTASSSRLGPSWSVSPYEDKFFIENRGQYDGKDKLPGSQIYFGCDNKSTQMYFTKNGMTYRYDDKKLVRKKDEKEEGKSDEERNREMMEQLVVTTYMLNIEWLNSNPNVEIVSEGKVPQYWNFQTNKDNESLNFVPAYEKLIYKNLYPNIDVEYVFHQKEGIKYTLTLHPGADISKVQMKYKGADKISKDLEGNMHFNFKGMGDIIDHAPVTFYKNNNAAIVSSFDVSNNIVSFKLQNYDNTQTVVIDPWVTNPAFLGGANKGYDVTKDVSGNVYVYGGTTNQYQCKKFTSGGAPLWTYTASTLSSYYGDMALDFAGNAYLSSGCCSGGMIIKLNPAGGVIFSASGSGISEMWRLAQDCNYSKLVGGGGYPGLIANVNKTTGALSSVTNIGAQYELRSYAVDPAGNIFSLAVTIGSSGIAASNVVIKSNPAFVTQYTVGSGYLLEEFGIYYTSINFAGFSGIVIDNNFIYTYDGATIFKRNITTGATISSVAVVGGTATQDGGIYLDGCSNVYVGTMNSIRKYDSNLAFLTSVPTTGAVYDIVMGINNEVLASGNGFVASYAGLAPCLPQLNITAIPNNIGCGNTTGSATASVSGGSGAYTFSWSSGQTTQNVTGLTAGTYTITVTDFNGCNGGINTQTVSISSSGGNLTVASAQTNASCGQQGSASVTATSGTGPYTYSWNPSGQLTQTATGLTAGTYTVTVTDNTGCTSTKTFAITSGGGTINTSITAQTNVSCFGGNNGNATASASGGTGPYTYSWNNGQTAANVTGLTAGTYTVATNDINGCTQTVTVTITQPALLTAAISCFTDVSCNGGSNGSATVTGAGGTSGYTYLWSNAQTAANATGLAQGNYTVTITDNKGCTATTTLTIAQPAALTLTSGTTFAICNGSNGTASVTALGGTSSYTYLWSAGSQATVTATGLSAGSYSVLVTDSKGCTQTSSATVTNNGAPSSGISASTNVSCFGGNNGSATVTVAGGNGTLTYAWSPSGGAAATGNSLTAGTYTVLVTDVNGCTTTSSVIITEPTQLQLTATGTVMCGGQTASATSTAVGGTSGYTYLWSDGQTNANATGLSTGNYTLTVTDNKGCTATATAQITANPLPVIVMTASDTSGCAPLCVTFNCSTLNLSSYTWDFGDVSSGSGNTSSLQSPLHCYKNGGSYDVKLTIVDVNGCSSTITKKGYINVFPQPVADFTASPQPTTVLNATITFTDKSTGANTWSWQFGEGSSGTNNTSSLQNPIHTYADSGTYNVKLVVFNSFGCKDSINKDIVILGEYLLFAPNAFTPDGDGLNDVWNVKGIGIDIAHFELYVFDRWGNLIYQNEDLNKGWNGHANGGKDIAQQDVYVWKVFTRDFLGTKHSYIGHVSLVR